MEVQAKGRVARTTGTGMGMEIYEIPLDAYGHLKSLVLHNSMDLIETEKEFDLHQGLKKKAGIFLHKGDLADKKNAPRETSPGTLSDFKV